ncbi:MAG: hypothetical protein K1X71_10625 [Pirellulales bacterium]|nr:hypothetical protein [Pirellulales bacterium]
MTLALSITDNEDGSGALATIGGSALGAMNDLFVRGVNGQLSGADWILAGARLGDGDLALALATGYYWGYVASTVAGATGISNLVYFQVTSGADALLYRCLLATQARIVALALPGLGAASVLVQKLASDRDLGAGRATALPAIVVSPAGREQMPRAGGTNWRDETIYPVQVTLLVADHQQQTPYLAQTLGWRERIARAFRHQPLVGVDEVFDCELLPQEIVASEVFVRHGVWASALVLGFCAREPRGMGA